MSKPNSNNFFSLLWKDYIDANGDSEGNYTVISLQDVDDDLGVSWQMKPVGYFYYSSQSSVIPVRSMPFMR